LNAFIVDTHCDSVKWLAQGVSLRNHPGHLDLTRLNSAVKLQFFAMFVESSYKPQRAMERTLELIDLSLQSMEQNKDVLTMVNTREDLQQLTTAKTCGALLAIEGGEAIIDTYMVRHLFRLGVRSIGLTWNQRNRLADGVLGGSGGLTQLGKKVVKEMNALGILVDAAHMSPKSFWDVLRTSSQPIIVSHANCRALCDHVRNLTDLQIKTLAAQDGVFCLTFAPDFLKENGSTIDDLLDHIAYAADLIGPEHIGIGSDFDGVDSLPEGLKGVEDYYKIYQGLEQRGFSESECQAISGGNVRKLLMRILPKEVGKS